MLNWPIKKQLSHYSRLLTLITCIRSLSSLSSFPPELNHRLDMQYQQILSLQPYINDTLSQSLTLVEDKGMESNESDESDKTSESSENDENDENDGSHLIESSRRKSSHCGCSLILFVLSALLMGIIFIPVSSYTCSHVEVILPYSDMTEYLQGYCREYERGIGVVENQRVRIYKAIQL